MGACVPPVFRNVLKTVQAMCTKDSIVAILGHGIQ